MTPSLLVRSVGRPLHDGLSYVLTVVVGSETRTCPLPNARILSGNGTYIYLMQVKTSEVHSETRTCLLSSVFILSGNATSFYIKQVKTSVGLLGSETRTYDNCCLL